MSNAVVLPARLVSTKSGLYFQWAYQYRVRIEETSPVLADDEFAAKLGRGLDGSDWVPPPSLKKPTGFRSEQWPLKKLDLILLKRAWNQAVKGWYGQALVNLGLRIYPRGLNLLLLSRIKAFQPLLEARLAEQPKLGPVLGSDTSLWPNLRDWRVIKARLLAMGLSQRAWRWLARCPGGYVAQIDWNDLSHLAWVNFHAHLNVSGLTAFIDRQTAALVGFGSLSSWVRRVSEQSTTQSVGAVIRAIRLCLSHLAQAENAERAKDIVLEELPLIADWIKARVALEGPKRERVGRNWTYDTLVAKQAHWHLSEVAFAQPNQNVFWPEFLGAGSLNSTTEYFELTSLYALLKEARKMHHCVPSYIDRCLSGEIVLFHLSRRGSKPERATLELGRRGATGWKIAQLKGPCNVPVSAEMQKSAQQLLMRLGDGPALT